MPALKADLPDHLYWLTEKVQSLVRPGAFLVPADDKGLVPAMGSTRTSAADVPLDASWAAMALPDERGHRYWSQSPYDGESLYLQLNLEEIPLAIREQRPDLPEVGVVWLTFDANSMGCNRNRHWETHVYFDARSASDIAWVPRKVVAGQRPPGAMKFVLADTLTCATELTLPEIYHDHRGGFGMCADYDDWWSTHYGGRQRSDLQVGGWMLPIQGDADDLRPTLLVAIERQDFGDSGALYLHYSPERGFWAHAETC